MIIPPTDFYYVVRTCGEVAGAIITTLFMNGADDIKEVTLISSDFDNDIEATICLDETIELITDKLVNADLKTEINHNPLYKPSTREELEQVLDGESNDYNFIGMQGNPFILRATKISSCEEEILEGHISCKPFELPSYNDISAARANARLN